MVVAVSSWALHRTIGTAYWNSPTDDVFERTDHAPNGTDIRTLAKEIAGHGFNRLELCHFHLESRDGSYLGEVRRALKEAGITLQTLLIDSGDITDRDCDEEDTAWISDWIHAGMELGAEAARVIAGKRNWSPAAFDRSCAHLRELSEIGLRIRVENWFDLLATPDHVHQLLDCLGGRVGLCVDFGNWSQAEKYEHLAQIAGRAETCHAKAEFLEPSLLDERDYSACIDACQGAGFAGPYVLVNGGSLPTDWQALDIQRDFLLKHSEPALKK